MSNNKLDIIDYAVLETKYAHKDYPLVRFCGAFKQYLNNYDNPSRANGFTRFNGARDNFNTLSKEDIYSELLKNIVKLKAYRKYNGKKQALKISDTFTNDMNTLEKEEWLYHQIMYSPLDGINEMISVNEDIMNSLIFSFIDSRYSFDQDKDYKYDGELDNLDNLNDDEFECLKEIDYFYKKKYMH